MSSGLPYHRLIISAVEYPVRDFCIIRFKPTRGISYKAGQYLTFVFPEYHPEIRRSYSLVSMPGDEHLAIGVKRKSNGMISRRLFEQTKTGDELLCIGAAGMFTLPAEQPERIIFFAAGSGITPIFSLIRSMLADQKTKKIILVYSNRSESLTIFHQELKKLAAEHSGRLLPLFLFSDHPVINQARLTRELMLNLMKQYKISADREDLFFICGPELYMFKVTTVLQEQGIKRELIRKENFVIPVQKPVASVIPDTGDHVIHILSDSADLNVMVRYPQSILQAARFEGIILPFSCETGRCGNCVARCVSGKLWHSNNEVLTDRDLDQGLILTCTAHPLSDDVIIRTGI